ncbi:MAG: Flp family type IVb pilin [Candidatus Hermodarchaeota archaeon]
MTIRSVYKKIKKSVRNFFLDEQGGNLVEYALLIGFALFIFFILVGVITSLLDWTLGLSDDFFQLIGGIIF